MKHISINQHSINTIEKYNGDKKAAVLGAAQVIKDLSDYPNLNINQILHWSKVIICIQKMIDSE